MNFPMAWHGKFRGHKNNSTIILEAWIGHTFFGMIGSCKWGILFFAPLYFATLSFALFYLVLYYLPLFILPFDDLTFYINKEFVYSLLRI
jgi:hypothetical protein